MEETLKFPMKCCVCLTDCDTFRELRESTSRKVGFYNEITTYKCSVPVCKKCESKFGRLNYGWWTWFAFILLGVIIGAIAQKAFIAIAAFVGMIGIFPALVVAFKFPEKTEDPVYLQTNGIPHFKNKEYQRLFEELNGIKTPEYPKYS